MLAALDHALDSTTLPLQVVPALAAALFARFTSFWIACAWSASRIGMLENVLYYLADAVSWFPTDNGVALPGVNRCSSSC